MTNKKLLDPCSTLYIDFEGNKAGELFLVGLDYGEGYKTWILDPALKGWAEAKGYRFATIEDLLSRVSEAETVVAYSSAEKKTLNALAEQAGFPLASNLKYLDARKVTVVWANRFKKYELDTLPELGRTLKPLNRPKRKSLISLARLAGMDGWTAYGFGLVTKRLGQVKAGLRAKGGQFDKLTPHQKKQASKVITHNRFDIEAMQELIRRALSDCPALCATHMTSLVD